MLELKMKENKSLTRPMFNYSRAPTKMRKSKAIFFVGTKNSWKIYLMFRHTSNCRKLLSHSPLFISILLCILEKSGLHNLWENNVQNRNVFTQQCFYLFSVAINRNFKLQISWSRFWDWKKKFWKVFIFPLLLTIAKIYQTYWWFN